MTPRLLASLGLLGSLATACCFRSLPASDGGLPGGGTSNAAGTGTSSGGSTAGGSTSGGCAPDMGTCCVPGNGVGCCNPSQATCCLTTGKGQACDLFPDGGSTCGPGDSCVPEPTSFPTGLCEVNCSSPANTCLGAGYPACTISSDAGLTTCVNATYSGLQPFDPGWPSHGWAVVGTAPDGQCGCVQDFPLYEFAPCPGHVTNSQNQAECGCPLQCAGPTPYDHFCEFPCPNGEDDCPWNADCATYAAGNKACAPNPCTDAGTGCGNSLNPGTCMPMWTYSGPSLYCFEGGASLGHCNPDPYYPRKDRSYACRAGYYCLATAPDAGSCTPICDPNAPNPNANGCPAGTHCGVVFDGVPTFGACVACLPRRAPCQANADCCSGDCEPGCSFDYSQGGWGQGCMECR